jgi:hypothetical protein
MPSCGPPDRIPCHVRKRAGRSLLDGFHTLFVRGNLVPLAQRNSSVVLRQDLFLGENPAAPDYFSNSTTVIFNQGEGKKSCREI